MSRQEEVLEVLRPVIRQGKEQEALVRFQSLATIYEGPIPLASELVAYERAHPGAADRILTMAEQDQANAFALNTMLITHEATLRGGGQTRALIALLAMLGVTVVALLLHQPIVAGVLGGGTIIAVVAMFLRQQATIRNADGGEVRVGGDTESGGFED